MEDGSNGWFYAKRYGYGSGLPRSWQGWVATALFVGAALAASIFLAPVSMLAYVGVMIFLTSIFLLVAKRTTTGGWKWRMGKDRDGGTW